ncbi:OmpA family protein [Cyclobacterium qasimii]|uniref:OmpA/MotB domain protein n=1 Tax=Cyclobacterium qasimii M12-11B TaxID=641524 RepID=S7VE03_9BACT|nr:OmpA family protein [Cyclobacterium qasimii]EPR68475.1 OmpA/MotB domain protein [Cyclobacterium qasimii M12-11B]
MGDFPFFSLPDGLKNQNKPVKRSYDKLYFPIDGVMTALEGKVWKSSIVKTDESDEDWSLPYFENSYDNAITAIGGVKIFDGEITNEEYNSYRSKATYLGEEGSMGYAGQIIKVYLIRRSNGDDIYIQLTGNSAYGKLNILQKAPFEQTITMLKSDQIQKDLNDKGKVILYINFETDKATLQKDGKDAVSEISKALQSDKNLKISINGYTDNIGNETHNLKLSKDRAETVKNSIIASGIDSYRLTSDGFGPKDPISENDTEEGRTKNRRVELIKK